MQSASLRLRSPVRPDCPGPDLALDCRHRNRLRTVDSTGNRLRANLEPDVRRVAVFGNTGGGKSTVARRLAELTHLPLFPLDLIQYREGGGQVPHDEYLEAHAGLITRDAWIIDGFGCVRSAWERFAAADTLVYIDLPLPTHCWWVTKRLLKSILVSPEGWPKGSPMLRSTLNSYRVLWLCHRRLTPRYRRLVADVHRQKRVHHLRSPEDIQAFLEGVELETKVR